MLHLRTHAKTIEREIGINSITNLSSCVKRDWCEPDGWVRWFTATS
jgi:hypothetical protein